MRRFSALLLTLSLLLTSGCGYIRSRLTDNAPVATAVPDTIPTDTVAQAPTAVPTLTLAPPSATPVPPSATPVPPSATAIPPSATPVPPTLQPTLEPTLDVAELQVEDAAPTAAPTQVNTAVHPSVPVAMELGAIGLAQPLIPVGLDANNVPIVPKHDVGWYQYSAKPGQGENVVLWGHVLRFTDTPDIPAPFARLREVPVGEAVTVYTEDGAAHTYVITEHVWVTPDQVQYILPQGEERLTLVSCIGDKVIIDGSLEMTHRLITIAKPVT